VRVALKDHPATRDINVTILAHRGWVTLQGIVLNAEERMQTESIVGAVPGVAEVVNELRLMASSRLFASAKYT
jgi:osmotically-inducible protein OsmY